MSQSLASIVIHLIFSTKGREPVLAKHIQLELYPYLAMIAKQQSSYVYEVGGIEDHVHMLLTLPRTVTLAKLVELIKKESSKWLKRKYKELEFFGWQNGYGAFSVSQSKISVVMKYIKEQELHHKKTHFKEEFLIFLKNTGISFDEQYLWN